MAPAVPQHPGAHGWIYLGYTAVDGETGEETEEYALYLCTRCREENEGRAG